MARKLVLVLLALSAPAVAGRSETGYLVQQFSGGLTSVCLYQTAGGYRSIDVSSGNGCPMGPRFEPIR